MEADKIMSTLTFGGNWCFDIMQLEGIYLTEASAELHTLSGLFKLGCLLSTITFIHESIL